MSEQPAGDHPELHAWQEQASHTLAELTAINAELHPERSTLVFLQVFKTLRTNPSVSGNEALEQLERAQSKGIEAPYMETALVVSAAYLAEAHQHLDRQSTGKAWESLASARYWCGVMRSVTHKLDFTLHAVDAIRRAESGTGGKSRARNYAAAKKLVVELANLLRPTRGWDSRREAVMAMEAHLDDLAPDNSALVAVAVVSKDRWERTFSDWLGEELTKAEFRYLFPRSELPSSLRN